MKDFRKELKEKILVFDGAMGTILQGLGLESECPEMWNLKHSEEVKRVHSLYKESGSDIIQTNTFGGTRIKLSDYGHEDKVLEINSMAVKNAKEVAGDSFVALSVGPTGRLFEPYGDLSFDEAYEAFKEQVQIGEKSGADIINLETFTDLAEIRTALIAAKENTKIPVVCSMSFEKSGRTLMGTSPEVSAIVLDSLGADVVGSNCSGGHEHILELVIKISKFTNLPLIAKPNAGLPQLCGDKVCYFETPQEFAKDIPELIKNGASIIGGCCGSTPEFIREIKRSIRGHELIRKDDFRGQFITSSVNIIDCNEIKIDSILKMVITKVKTSDKLIDQALDEKKDFHNVILLNIDESDIDIKGIIYAIQSYVKLPLIFETVNRKILENGLRYYNGRAGVIIEENTENYEDIISIAKKYGAFVFLKEEFKS